MPTDSSPAVPLAALIADAQATPRRVCDFLDSLPEPERIAATRSLTRSSQQRLWRLVEGFGELSLEHFAPAKAPLLQPVRHYGRNSLPAFVIFEKRFYRLGDGSQVGGANFQAIQPFTGPGYFVTTEDTKTREVLVDYRQIPTQMPDGWPRIRGNEVGVSRFIYGFMVDRMRRVSEHVTIGRASKHGKDMSAWFVLCREATP